MKMEPNNMENQFRDKLNKREISPSENSWDRLDAMLTVSEKPKRNFRWMYIAASFLGFILIATVFFSQTEEVVDSKHNEVVIEEKQTQEKGTSLENVLEIPTEKVIVEKVATSEKQIIVQKKKEILNPKSNQIDKVEQPTETAIVSNDKNNSSIIITRERSSNWRSNQKTNVKVDANALLASVENNEPAQAVAQNTVPVKVNSNELLSQVDGELELSFRERVIQSVNKKYREVKVAVANRNLE